MLDSLPIEEMFDEFDESPDLKKNWSKLLEEDESPVQKVSRKISNRYDKPADKRHLGK